MSPPGAPIPRDDRARRRRRPWLWLAGTILVSAAGLWLAWTFDQRTAPPRAPEGERGPIADLRPSALTESERSGGSGPMSARSTARLEEGAWVQVAGPDGRIKQQYRAAQINPLPDKRIAMRDPQAVLYGANGRVATMRSDAMTAAVPKGELESGRLEGRVVIRLYTPRGDKPVNLATDAAELVIEAPEAEFDLGSGEIRADRSVTITSEALSFVGEGLNLTLSQDGRNIERLTVDRPLSPIRIERSAAMLQERSRGLRPTDAGTAPSAPGTSASQGAARGASSGALSGIRTGTQGDGPRGTPEAPGMDANGASGARAHTRDTGGAPSGGSPNAPAPVAARPFVLTIMDNVEVVSQEPDRRVTMRGQELRVVFTLKSGIGEGLVMAPGREQRSAPEPVAVRAVAVEDPAYAETANGVPPLVPGAHAPLRMQPALAAIGSLSGGPSSRSAPESDHALTIAYTGRLILEPALSTEAALPSPSAVRVRMEGAPARVEDAKSGAVLTGKFVQFVSESEDVLLAGTAEEYATVESPDFGMRAETLRLNRSTGLGGVEGPGSLRLGSADKRPINLTWKKGARFTLAPGSQDAEGSFRGADFAGEVAVRSRDFALDAGALSVEAEPVGKRDVLRRLVATDGVRAQDLGERGGVLEAERMEMALVPDASGNALPRTLHAIGGVMVADARQTLWAEGVRVAFLPPRAPQAERADGSSAPRADVGSVIAEGPVELRLPDGSRAWASRMEADAVGGTARLSGPNVLVVRGNTAIDQLADLQVQEKPGRLSVAGPGRASSYRDALLPVTNARLGRPTLLQVPVMQATWREGLAYAERVVAGRLGAPDRGLLLMQGAVKIRASRSPLEAEALDADEVQIELEPHRIAADAAAKGAPAGAVPGSAAAAGRASMAGASSTAPDLGSVARMQARGHVRIETQEWRDATRAGEPRLFRLLSTNAAYDVKAGLCSVDGAGTILVNDPPAPAGVRAGGASASPFSPEGITKFTWQRSLGMTNGGDGVTTVALDGSVQMQHLGAGDAGSGTLVADHLEATVRGRPEREAKPADGGPLLGAGATLERVLARGRVTVRTSEFDVETGEFSLDEVKQVALLTAVPGRAVSIVKRGAETLRAESASWEMVSGTIKVLKARGSLPR